MAMTYFKRFRMEIDLTGRELPTPAPPPGYFLLGWDAALLKPHAQAKHESFRFEMDANVFPCLGNRSGCLSLMSDISRKDGFVPSATWLLAYQPPGEREYEYCGTIQGIRDQHGVGAIQNIGVTPAHRGKGLGSVMILRSLVGFRQAGIPRVYLEVTAQNEAAIRLYQRLGFVKTRTVYKAADLVDVAF
jgi:hypothetical protein